MKLFTVFGASLAKRSHTISPREVLNVAEYCLLGSIVIEGGAEYSFGIGKEGKNRKVRRQKEKLESRRAALERYPAAARTNVLNNLKPGQATQPWTDRWFQ